MKTLKSLLCLIVLGLSTTAWAQGKEISYDIGSQKYNGYLATPSGAGPFAAVLIVHEWWGLENYARMRADQLAKLGYVALAMDMYGDGKTANNPKDAGALAGAALKNWPSAFERVQKAVSVLKEQSTVDKTKVAAIGYCFGGGVLLNAARSGLDINGVVSFHGSLKPLTDDHKFKTKILVLNGAADPMVTKDEITAFKTEMKQHQVAYEFVDYPGALHAFTNPKATKVGKEFNLPVAYNQEADQQSWAKMKEFLKSVF